MRKHEKHREPTLRSEVRVLWCEDCDGWTLTRAWVHAGTGEPYAPWISHTEELFVANDEYADATMRKWLTAAAQLCKLLERGEAVGQSPLSV